MPMSTIRLPAGQSLRQIAATLGVDVEKLRSHAGIDDVERVLDAERQINVPDGFLRSERVRADLEDAITTKTSRKGGMNSWLAMDIEHKRARLREGEGRRQPTTDELEALDDAERALYRFEAASNRLAIDLLAPLATRAKTYEVRARAFSAQALAHCLDFLRYGASARKTQPAALSSAKGALLADPKCPRARLVMGLALWIRPQENDSEEALDEMMEAIELDLKDSLAWGFYSEALLEHGELDAALEAAERGIKGLQPSPVAHIAAGRAALGRRDTTTAKAHWQTAATLAPEDPTPHAHLALQGSIESSSKALALATTDMHREFIEAILRRGAWPHAHQREDAP